MFKLKNHLAVMVYDMTGGSIRINMNNQKYHVDFVASKRT